MTQPTTPRTAADVARLSVELDPQYAERWCDSRGVSYTEAFRIFSAARCGNVAEADRIWRDEQWWTDRNSREFRTLPNVIAGA
jgi:hypothetical protein